MEDFGLKRYICLIFGIFARAKDGRVFGEGPVTNERKEEKRLRLILELGPKGLGFELPPEGSDCAILLECVSDLKLLL
jgi:hypothetical protein